MKPIFQTKFSSEDGSVHGNCMAACIASLLEIDIDQVPKWEDMGEEWADSFIEFLETNGCEYQGSLQMSELSAPGKWEWILDRCHGIDGFFMVGGSSPRDYVKRGHAAIYKDGILVHDPHPSGKGLLKVIDVYLIEKIDNRWQ